MLICQVLVKVRTTLKSLGGGQNLVEVEVEAVKVH